MEVPSTQTSSDRNEEKKRHADDMAILNSKKEIALRETMLAVEAADKATQRIDDLTKRFQSMNETVGAVSQETRDFIAHCAAILHQSAEKVQQMIDMAHVVEQKALHATEVLTKAEAEYKTIHDALVSENASLDIKRSDLDIYHSRLKEYFEKHLPGHVITL